MPTYVYRCLDCDKQFEVQQRFTDDALTVCNCEKAMPVRKVFTPVGVTFKGSGFYKNDSRGSSSKSSTAASTSGDKADSSGSSSTASSSSDSSGSSSTSTPSTSSGTSPSTSSNTTSSSGGSSSSGSSS